ncbi:MAG: hypothetical protein E6K97_07780 [Thaumarchaeota archaeon]|nr:MAG: hypothetical protein E6K97_07780 [Nitrososphaerota archaeon]
MNRKFKACQIIPVNVYDGTPPVVFEDDKWRYILRNTGHLLRLRRKTCSICPVSMSYVVIFEYSHHRRVERFCAHHAEQFGALPEIPQTEITSKQKLALQKWSNIKVKI